MNNVIKLIIIEVILLMGIFYTIFGLHSIDVDYTAHRYAVIYEDNSYLTDPRSCDMTPFNMSCVRFGILYVNGMGMTFVGIVLTALAFYLTGVFISEYSRNQEEKQGVKEK